MDALLIHVAFPRGVYSGAELGAAEELPTPARLHAAFVSAAGGGPDAEPSGRVLQAPDRHREAIKWLEATEPLAIVTPQTRLVHYDVSRYRLRAAADHNNETGFEPFCALSGPVTFAWPAPGEGTFKSLAELAAEVTHVGRADTTAIVRVEHGARPAGPHILNRVEGRGPGRAMRVARSGRLEVLEAAHATALRPGRHGAGNRGPQAADVIPYDAGQEATELVRFAAEEPTGTWPMTEVWCSRLSGVPSWALRVDRRVAVAVAAHRAAVAAIGFDVPSFITGRDGSEPLRGAGHLIIQPIPSADGAALDIVFGLPPGLGDADRVALLTALESRPVLRLGRRHARIDSPEPRSARRFWPAGAGAAFETAVPVVLDAPGPPRRGRWTLDDAVICSVGYALRGVLETDGLEWEAGWPFRQALVAHLRDRGVEAEAHRVTTSASAFVHRARPGDLLVAVDASVCLGDLDPEATSLLAIGRARHLGGGLLRPTSQVGR